MKGIKKPSFSTIIVLLFVILLICGVLIIYLMRKKYSWECIATIVSLLSFLATLLIPILVLDIQRKIDDNNTNNKVSNLKFEDELSVLKSELEKLKEKHQTKIDSESKITASDIYDYICVSMFVTVKDIANHFNTTTDEIKPFISLLCLRDNLIQSYLGVDPKDPDDNSTWFKRRN